MGAGRQDELALLSDEVRLALGLIEEEIRDVPSEERLQFLRSRLASFPAHIQGVVFAAYRIGRDEYMERKEAQEDRERRLGFLWGVGFLLLLVIMALFIKEPSLWQYTLFRIILALSAAGFTNYIEGMLNVKWKFIRAAGPLAVFIIVYFFSPAALVTNPPG